MPVENLDIPVQGLEIPRDAEPVVPLEVDGGNPTADPAWGHRLGSGMDPFVLTHHNQLLQSGIDAFIPMHVELAGLDRNRSPFVCEADLRGIYRCAHPDRREGHV
jgi:hypothetical protein